MTFIPDLEIVKLRTKSVIIVGRKVIAQMTVEKEEEKKEEGALIVARMDIELMSVLGLPGRIEIGLIQGLGPPENKRIIIGKK
jgi:hypothetical protein